MRKKSEPAVESHNEVLTSPPETYGLLQAAQEPPGGKETSAILPKLAGGKSNNNGTFWREQISSHVILIAEFQSRSLASVACQLITTLVSFLAPETFESASKKRPGMPVSSTERK